MNMNTRPPTDDLSKFADGLGHDPDRPRTEVVLETTDTIAEFRRVSALAVDEIAAWADILHPAA